MWRHRLEGLASVLAWFVAGLLPCSLAAAQDTAPPSIAEQLQAQYKLVKLGSDSTGLTVIDQGSLLTIQKDGIVAVPWDSLKPCASTYQNGTLKPPSGWCVQGKDAVKSVFKGLFKKLATGEEPDEYTGVTTRTFKAGEKVYLGKIEVDVKSERIVLVVIACDTCNNTDPPTYYKATVAFQFGKGFLETGDVSQVEDVIGQVLSLDDTGGAQ